MAELPKNIRRVGGELVSAKQPYGRRLLLPSEVELCKLLNCSEDEYWYFVEKTAAYNGKRKEGYELIPDIKASGLELYIAGQGLTALGSFVVSVALTAIGYLLTPKPKPLKAGEARRSADALGTKRFAPQHSFNSVQELANIGDVIPLVFADQTEKPYEGSLSGKVEYLGGVRVNSQLLWSQLLSLGNAQQLKAIVLFSLGEIDDSEGNRPEFAGYAIGDLLLSSYSNKKLDLFFKSSPYKHLNNRLSLNDKYSESGILGMDYLSADDVFADKWFVSSTKQSEVYPFSGTRNPTTQAIFGAYSPMPNANVIRLAYQLHWEVKGTDNKAKAAVATKQKKIAAYWPTRAGFSGASVTHLTEENNEITYTVLENSQTAKDNYLEGYKPHGVEDVVSMIKSIREEIDQNIAIGEMYLAGDAVLVCTGIDTIKGNENDPWYPKETIINDSEEQVIKSGIRRVYKFRVEEVGTNYENVRVASNGGVVIDPQQTGRFICNQYPPHVGGLEKHAQNPQYGPEITKRGGEEMKENQLVGTDYYDTSTNFGFPYTNPILQRVAIGSVTNNRPCAQTEIGLKSKVFSHIRGANLNSQPKPEELSKMFDDKVQFQLGNIDQYITRFSFFKLQMRKAGTVDKWQDLIPREEEKHTGLFCVRGNTPEVQYNYIRITHPEPFTQYEYRFKPVPGNNIALYKNDPKNPWKVNLLNAKYTAGSGSWEDQSFDAELQDGETTGYCVVSFKGNKNFELGRSIMDNNEWKLSLKTGLVVPGSGGGPVTGLDSYLIGKDDIAISPSNVVITLNSANISPTYEYAYEVYDDRKSITLISLNQDHLADGGSTWAWIAYEDGVEVGHVTVPAGTPSTEIEIIADNGNTYTPDVHPHITNHPEAPIDPTTGQAEVMPVHYYKVNKEPNLTITSIS